MKKNSLTTRSTREPRLAYRTMRLLTDATGAPATLDEQNRSVEVVGVTENPVEIFDYERFEVVPEILLMAGLEMPDSRQVPLLDTHNRWDGTVSVLGSYRGMKREGDQLVGRAYFSSVPEAEGPYTKLREGHLTDFSAGYRQIESTWVPDGESTIVKGKKYQGPVRVTSRWRIKELSICPIGADELARVRAANLPDNHNVPQPKRERERTEAMNKKLREWLEKRGLPADAGEDDAWAMYVRELEKLQLGETAPPAVDPPPDVDAARAEAVRLERERSTEIRAMCNVQGCPELADDMISRGDDLEVVRAKLLDHLAKTRDPKFGHRGPAGVEADERDKFRAAAEDALIIRAGVMSIEKPAPGANDLTGYTLRELARHCLQVANCKTGGNPMEMVGRAMLTSDFPFLLANVANKSIQMGWDTAGETWQVWVGTGSVSDFKTNYAPRASEMSDLDEIPDTVPYKYGARGEGQEGYSIATYGKLFALSRQTIINDDLGALTDIPMAHGEAAARKVGDVVYAVLTANAVMGDGLALFSTDHANYVSSGAIPGIETMAAAILAMKYQLDILGLRRLNIRPHFFIAPAALEGTTEVFFRSERFVDSDTVATDSSLAATRANPYAGNYFTRVYEPRLDDDDPAAWYLAAAKGKTIKAFFLNGVQKPYLDSKDGWSVDGVEYKVRIDVGAKAMDWRGLFLNDGN